MSTKTLPRGLCNVCPSGQGRRSCTGQKKQHQGWWTGRSRSCAQREAEIASTSPGHECRAKGDKCCPSSPADLLDSISVLKNSTHSPVSVRAGYTRYQKHPHVSHHFYCSCQMTAHCRTASHTSLFWPSRARCCEPFLHSRLPMNFSRRDTFPHSSTSSFPGLSLLYTM